jgi:hypothetical protein
MSKYFLEVFSPKMLEFHAGIGIGIFSCTLVRVGLWSHHLGKMCWPHELCLQTDQGDQIGSIFDSWAISNFRQFFLSNTANIWVTFSREKFVQQI